MFLLLLLLKIMSISAVYIFCGGNTNNRFRFEQEAYDDWEKNIFLVCGLLSARDLDIRLRFILTTRVRW